MWELTKRLSLRTSSGLSKVEPEPDFYTGSGSDRLRNTAPATMHLCQEILSRIQILQDDKDTKCHEQKKNRRTILLPTKLQAVGKHRFQEK